MIICNANRHRIPFKKATIMNTHEFIGQRWDLYINGWFHHDKIIFLPEGRIENNGTEGFATWKINNDLLELYDEQNEICYSLKYISSASILINTAEHRIKNNNLFLARHYSPEELADIFPDNKPAAQIANRAALYKSREGEIWGMGMFFGTDGIIYNYHNPNEKYWKVENGSLKLYSEEGLISCVQEDISYNRQPFPQSVKQITLTHVESNNAHYLDFLQFQQSDAAEPAKFLNIDACFSNRSDTLLVVFNSAGGEYDGKYVNHEFYHLPYQFAVDHIRISQSKPTRIYLDDFEKIEALINLNAYRKIVFLGMSIGGYAAIWFAETLARKNKNTEYISIAVQPLTNLSKTFADSMRMKFRDGYRAKTLTDEIIAGYEASGLALNLTELLKEPLNNVIHYVAYDSLNEAEKESAGRLISDRTFQTAFTCALNHADGCVHIYDSGFLENLFNKLLITS